MNYIIGRSPAGARRCSVIRVDIDPGEIANSPRKLDVGVVGDVKTVLVNCRRRCGQVSPDSYATWRERLRGYNSEKEEAAEKVLSNPSRPVLAALQGSSRPSSTATAFCVLMVGKF